MKTKLEVQKADLDLAIIAIKENNPIYYKVPIVEFNNKYLDVAEESVYCITCIKRAESNVRKYLLENGHL